MAITNERKKKDGERFASVVIYQDGILRRTVIIRKEGVYELRHVNYINRSREDENSTNFFQTLYALRTAIFARE